MDCGREQRGSANRGCTDVSVGRQVVMMDPKSGHGYRMDSYDEAVMHCRTRRDYVPISVCIPTKDRPAELLRCIHSILNQSVLPEEIILIDDGNLERNIYQRTIEPYTRFKYHRKEKPSLSASKNLTKELASNDLILILDDDTVLEYNFIENIYKRFEIDKNRTIGAVCGLIINESRKSLFDKMMRKIFLLDNGKIGHILPWAFQTGFDGLKEDTYVDWIRGGISCIRKEVLEEFSFCEFHGGRNALEDVEFGWRVSRKYRLMVTPSARVYHFHSSAGREALFNTGYKQAYNRCWIFREHADKNLANRICFVWAMIGNCLGMAGKGKTAFAMGNVQGVFSYIRKEVLAVG